MKNKLFFTLLLPFISFPFYSIATGCDFQFELITENHIQASIDEFYELYTREFNDSHEARDTIKDFLREVIERTPIDFNSQYNEILMDIDCGRSIEVNINDSPVDGLDQYVIAILDLDNGTFELSRQTSTLNISFDYFNSDSYMVVASKLQLNGLDIIQNDNFSIIVADLDPINGGGEPNNNPPNAGGPTVFPNPFSGRMQINGGMDGFENFSEIQIQAIDGRVVRLLPLSPWSITNPSIELDGSDLRSGMYILRLIGYDDQIVFKILKE
jgi:hypothetical protein